MLFFFSGFFSAQASGQTISYIKKAEKAHNIPENLLLAIAQTESGKRVKKSIVPDPLCIQSKGKVWRPKNLTQALQIVRFLKKQGTRNIDVGCMQINLLHHPNAFPSLAEAFNAQKNIAYGARFFSGLACKFGGNWISAVGHYHSSKVKDQTLYKEKVLSWWQNLPTKNISAQKHSRKIKIFPQHKIKKRFSMQKKSAHQFEKDPLQYIYFR